MKQIRARIMEFLSNEFLDKAFFWTAVLTAIFGGLGLAFGLVSAMSGYIVTDRLQRASDEKIAAANERIKAAEKDAALANEAAGKAHERAAVLERESNELKLKVASADESAAKANLELFKLKESLKPRNLTGMRRQIFVDNLKAVAKTKITVAYHVGPDDVLALAGEIASALREAGFANISLSMFPGANPPNTPEISVLRGAAGSKEIAVALVSTFAKVGFTSDGFADPGQLGTEITIILGPNPKKQAIAAPHPGSK
jgi:hypothetical protein